MSEMKSLAKDTAIYGLSSIIGKFLNYLLVPLYTYVLARTDDYGIVTNGIAVGDPDVRHGDGILPFCEPRGLRRQERV